VTGLIRVVWSRRLSLVENGRTPTKRLRPARPAASAMILGVATDAGHESLSSDDHSGSALAVSISAGICQEPLLPAAYACEGISGTAVNNTPPERQLLRYLLGLNITCKRGGATIVSYDSLLRL
jgi:hypothetical protein